MLRPTHAPAPRTCPAHLPHAPALRTGPAHLPQQGLTHPHRFLFGHPGRYGGLNTGNLDNTHAVAPEKFILATEACNCPGVIYEEQPAEWWQRAEHIGMDVRDPP